MVMAPRMHKPILPVAQQKQELNLLKRTLAASGLTRKLTKRKLTYFREFLSR
jgi:hypothetical protein